MYQSFQPTEEARTAVRCPMPEHQSSAVLQVGRKKQDVQIVNVSATGYRVQMHDRPIAEPGDILQLESAGGTVEARVVYVKPRDDDYQLGLQWVRDLASEPRGSSMRYTWLQRNVLVLGVAAVFASALSPFVSTSQFEWRAPFSERPRSVSSAAPPAGGVARPAAPRRSDRSPSVQPPAPAGVPAPAATPVPGPSIGQSLRNTALGRIESNFPRNRKMRSDAPKDWAKEVDDWRRQNERPAGQPTPEEVEEALDALGYLEAPEA